MTEGVESDVAPRTYEDLREFIARADELGELRRIDGVDAHLELGAVSEAAAEKIVNPPALLFDNIKGSRPGFRVLSLSLASVRRSALAFGLPVDRPKMELLRMAARKLRDSTPIPPVVVADAPILENVYLDDDVDLGIFPTPLYHEHDGGPYIGTGCMIVNRDPDSGYVNMGTYRVQVHDRNTLGLWISPGQQGRQIAQKYWDRGQSCPVAITFGGDLVSMMAAHTKLPEGVPELDYAGGLHGHPVSVVDGRLTDLPIPGFAEIAVEGEIPPPDVESREEGPFGEWPGYYSGGSRGTGDHQPVVRVKALYHRNDPIIVNMSPTWPGAPLHGFRPEAGLLWEQLEAMGIEGVTGVWHHYHYFIVVAIKQHYAGHAKQAGLAAISCSATARNGRYVVVVDDDIDPSNIPEVLWAMQTRVDPATNIDIIADCWSTPLDPRMSPTQRENRDYTSSRAVFYAVRPYPWRDQFPAVSRVGRELKEQVITKFRDVVGFP